MRAVRSARVSRYRRTGADLPWGDPRRYHGVPLEGHCWRFTDAAAGRVVLALCGVNRDRAGRSWGFVGLAAHPGGFFRSAIVADAAADRRRLGVRAGTAFSADAEHVRLDLGPDCRLEAALGATGRWPRAAFGALGCSGERVPGGSQRAVRSSSEIATYLPAFALASSQARTKPSRSPSSTRSALPTSKSVRWSLTIVYGCRT